MTKARRFHGKWVALALAALLLTAGWATGRLAVHPLEIVGVVSGIACTLLMIEQSILNFPAGIINILASAVLYFLAKLYGNMGLQLFYAAFGVVGWVHWARQGGEEPLRITRTRAWEWLLLPALGLPAIWLLTLFLRHTGSAAPFLDALTTVLALSAQYLLNRKRLEHWLVGLVLVVFSGIMCAGQGLWLYAALFGFFFVTCILGFRAWLHAFREQDAPAPVLALPLES
ncbi:MAG: Nicotinamide riboside transporter PnuC [bacterium ADurb.Bin429]|nr:MAG: Nicotinamide riboside transporter PnuC [bacterium ADurb.Bin429]